MKEPAQVPDVRSLIQKALYIALKARPEGNLMDPHKVFEVQWNTLRLGHSIGENLQRCFPASRV